MAKRYTPPPQLTAEQYKSELDVVAGDVDEANCFYQIGEEMNALLLADEKVFIAVNEQPLFWKAHLAANQAALFMSLSRVFDIRPDAKSLHALMRITRDNFHVFSKVALRTRKMEAYTTPPEWLDRFMQSTWEPEKPADLYFLNDALKPHAQKFRVVYRPIRHNVYGHRLISDSKAGTDLFPQTNRHDLAETIDFLQKLIDSLKHLYVNGIRPNFGGDFTAENQSIREDVRKVMRRLARNETLGKGYPA